MLQQKKDKFSGRLGVVLAATGSAVGLGNIWRFPYVVGENGGGAFLLVYIFFIVLIGVPVMTSEFVIGRRSQSNALGAFKKLSPNSPWWLIGMMGLLAAFIILAFYSTVAGWTLEYLFLSIKTGFAGIGAEQLKSEFNEFTSSGFYPILWQIIFLILTACVVLSGVRKGIEKYTKILMPILFLMIIAICIRSVTLPGASEGLRFLFEPDFSKLTLQGVLIALGQAAFSLSIGMGTLITYGSYIKKDTNLLTTSVQVAGADTLMAILSGIMIFPALIALGQNPASGPGLVFVTLPSIFEMMPGGGIIAIVFFVLLAVAALTSTVSILEVLVAYVKDRYNINRKKATIICSICVSILGVICTLSFGLLSDALIFDMTIFDVANYLSANVLLTFGALFIVIYTGWKLGKASFIDELKKGSKVSAAAVKIILFIIKWIAPVAMGAVAIGAFFIEGLT